MTQMIETPTRPSAFEASVAAAGRQFRNEVDQHEMTVLLDATADGGVHRHLRFARPGTGIWSFDLITYPGYLVVSGDIASFVFAAAYDMVGFFALRHGVPHPSYWAEKVKAGKVKGYSSDVLVEEIHQALEEARDSYSPLGFEKIRLAAESDLLRWPEEYDATARDALSSFHVSLDDEPDFAFRDTDEWDLTGFDHHYLLACHAVAWGTQKYLAEGGRIVQDPTR